MEQAPQHAQPGKSMRGVEAHLRELSRLGIELETLQRETEEAGRGLEGQLGSEARRRLLQALDETEGLTADLRCDLQPIVARVEKLVLEKAKLRFDRRRGRFEISTRSPKLRARLANRLRKDLRGLEMDADLRAQIQQRMEQAVTSLDNIELEIASSVRANLEQVAQRMREMRSALRDLQETADKIHPPPPSIPDPPQQEAH